jgi:hypothetical protein
MLGESARGAVLQGKARINDAAHDAEDMNL